MGQMSTGSQRQSHDGVAWLDQSHHHRAVGLRAGMGLHVDEVTVEQFFRPFDRQRFGHINILAATVVAPARIAFGIFIGQH